MAKELLKEAIADAKAVREVALQNAKMALEEAFDSKIKNMLSAKLAEELEEDVEIEETYMEDEKEKKSEAMSYDEDDKVDEAKDDKDDLDEAKDDDDLDEAYYEDDDGVDEEINLDELMAELDEVSDEDTMSEDSVYEDEDPFAKLEDALDERKKSDDDEMNESVVGALVGIPALIAAAGGLQAVQDKLENPEFAAKYPKLASFMSMLQKVGAAAGSARRSEGNNVGDETVDENFDIDALVAEIESSLDEDTVDEGATGYDEKVGGKGRTGFDDKVGGKGRTGYDGAVKKLKEERDEAMATVTSLQETLSEMNLLNSKLLYCNKLFRANALTEAQKVKVVDALDMANTANEAKLVFTTLQESFNFTGVEKRAIKEGLGRASKASGTAPKKVITESVDETVSRFQKLANIKF